MIRTVLSLALALMFAQFLEIFPNLVNHSRDNEPQTKSYYFFTSTKPDDFTLYGFEA